MIFQTLDLVAAPVNGSDFDAAMNMALDESLLVHARRPVLRAYGWARPAVSFGYFEKWKAVSQTYPERAWDLVRRWTGGGIVPHGEDWTYSVVVPREVPFAKVNAAESYEILHRILAQAMAGEGIEAALTPQAAAKVSQACFENPAQHDVLLAGRKIAGAAQKRSRFGLLHQGSVQGVEMPAAFARRLAALLGAEVQERCLSEAEKRSAEELRAAKYGAAAWNERF